MGETDILEELNKGSFTEFRFNPTMKLRELKENLLEPVRKSLRLRTEQPGYEAREVEMED